MGRRSDREELQATWTVLEPRVPGTPFRRKDIEDSEQQTVAPGPRRPGIHEDSPDLARLRRILK